MAGELTEYDEVIFREAVESGLTENAVAKRHSIGNQKVRRIVRDFSRKLAKSKDPEALRAQQIVRLEALYRECMELWREVKAKPETLIRKFDGNGNLIETRSRRSASIDTAPLKLAKEVIEMIAKIGQLNVGENPLTINQQFNVNTGEMSDEQLTKLVEAKNVIDAGN